MHSISPQLRRSTTAPSLFGDTVEGGVGNFVEPIIKPSIWPVQKSKKGEESQRNEI